MTSAAEKDGAPGGGKDECKPSEKGNNLSGGIPEAGKGLSAYRRLGTDYVTQGESWEVTVPAGSATIYANPGGMLEEFGWQPEFWGLFILAQEGPRGA